MGSNLFSSKIFWNIVSPEVHNLVSTAFQSGTIDLKLTETLIVPIPKIDVLMSLKDFRPISLCNVMLKIISKVLVGRIRPHLNSLISPFQSSFIPKRGTADNAIIAHEIVHSMNKKKWKKCYLLFKIDFEKAYDRVYWNFLRITLHDFCFLTSIITLIMNRITFSTLSLKWTNTKLESFIPQKGLR